MTLEEQTNDSKKNETGNKFVVPIIEIEGELAFEFPDELMEALDLQIGDTLEYTHVSQDRFIMKKVSQ